MKRRLPISQDAWKTVPASKLRQAEDSYLNEVLAAWLLNETGRSTRRRKNEWPSSSERRRAEHREKANHLRRWLADHDVELLWKAAK